MYTNVNGNHSGSSNEIVSSPEGGSGSRGSSVSTELREEYENLLRYAVVTPVFDAKTMLASRSGPSGASNITQQYPQPSKTQSFRPHSPPRRLEVKIVDSEESSRLSTPLSPQSLVDIQTAPTHVSVPPETILTTPTPPPPPPFTAMNVQANGRANPTAIWSHDQPLLAHDMTRRSHDHHVKLHDHLIVSHDRTHNPNPESEDGAGIPAMLVDPETTRLSNQLDMWCLDLKRNLLAEFEQSRIRLIEAQLAQFRREREQQAYELRQTRDELERYKELLVTYEQSIARKDHIISNLTRAMQKQKERVDLQRTFGSWKLRHCDEKREAFASALAHQHNNRKIKGRVWDAWFGILRVRWKNRVERACQSKAEEVCMELTADYEERLGAVNQSLAESQQEVANLKAERDLYEENMKKAFMRGVCALNLEAMTMFKPNEDTASSNGNGEVVHSQPPDPLTAHPIGPSVGSLGTFGSPVSDQRPTGNSTNKKIHFTAANSAQLNSRGHGFGGEAPSGGGGNRRGIMKSSGRGLRAGSRPVPAVVVQRHSE